MLGTLIGSLIGFCAAVAPQLLDMLRTAFAHRQAMREKQLEVDAAERGYQFEVTQKLIEQNAEEVRKLAERNAELECASQFRALEYLRGSVRPIITYAFFGTFFLIKTIALRHSLYVDHNTILDALPVIWDEETSSLFAAVISFWFGSRAMNTTTPAPTSSTVKSVAKQPSYSGSVTDEE